MAVISSKTFDGGSYDSCSTNLRFLASDTVFNCAERGTHPITLIVFDECNNSASCVLLLQLKIHSSYVIL
ncbi:MAG: hypothetical protein IPJ43_20530 [Saprospiraceae bacterium]|nr:hypothetical protein [Saprospiraceae bacterium]